MRMLVEVLAVLPKGRLLPESQDEAQASYTKEITKEEGKIDWTLTAPDIWRRVRAYQPWPEAYTFWQGKQLKIIEAVPLTAETAAEPGRVVALMPTQGPAGATFGIGTGNGILGILKVQIEGKRVMSAEEFLRGQRGLMGAELGDKG